MKIIYLSLLLILSQTIYSQDKFEHDPRKPRTDANLVGHVVDAGSNEHLPFVNIGIKGSTFGTSTDLSGHYFLTNLPEGNHILTVSAVGYKRIEKEVYLKGGTTMELNFELEADAINLDQVVITASRNAVDRKEAPVVVNILSSKTFQLTFAENLSDGLTFVPGVRVENNCQNCGFNQVRLNGLEGIYSQILINSRPVFSSLASVYGLELLPTGMIDRVEVIRGGGSALYGGNAIAGVINIITREPIQNTFQVGINQKITGVVNQNSKPALGHELFFNSGFTNFNNNSGIYIFGNHQSQNPWDANNDNFSELMLKKGYTAGFSTYYKPTFKSKITLDYYLLNEFRRGGDGFDRPFHDARISESVNHEINGGSINYFSYLENPNNSLNAYVAIQNVERQSYYGANYDTTAYGNTNSLSLNTGMHLTLLPDKIFLAPFRFTSGVDFNFIRLFDERQTSENSPIAQNAIVSNQFSATGGFFAQNEWMMFGRMRLLLGGRLDNYVVRDIEHGTGNYNSWVFVPRINVLTDINEKVQTRLSLSTGYRAPQIFDEDLHILTSGARKVIHRNDPDLTTERSYSVSASIDYSALLVNFPVYFLGETFFTRLRNPFTTELTHPDENGVVTALRINAEGGASVQGINLEAKLAPLKNMEIQTGFTFQQSIYDKEQQWGEDTNSVSRQIVRTPQQYGFVTFNYRFTNHLTTSLTGIYTGPMYVPHLPGGIAPDGTLIENEQLVKTPHFFDVGIKLAHLFDIGSDMHLELSLGVKNLFNSFQRDFDRGINRDAGYIYGPKIPRTVYFGLKLGVF